MASIQHKRDNIATVTDIVGQFSILMRRKKLTFFYSFKERLGTTESTSIPSNLLDLLSSHHDLNFLEDPFTEAEIDATVADLPSNKSLGPDSFSTDFIRKCWTIIKKDFYDLFHQFYRGELCFQSINNSFISLIPKKDGASTINDHRPISLLSCTTNLITKLLANRLQKAILEFIHINQYGFFKSRNIQDCVVWAYEYLHQCHKSKAATLVLKLDFLKAFDKIEHQMILAIVRRKGFGAKQCNWGYSILSYATSIVMLNGVLGSLFSRGVIQGDPLSPLLFVMAVDFLQTIINNAIQTCRFHAPIIRQSCPDYPVIQYAESTSSSLGYYLQT